MRDVWNIDFYRRHLLEQVLPFWERNGFDDECGGFFTCFANEGDALGSTDKYTWSQGRMVWVLATVAPMLGGARGERALAWAGNGADFLLAHCVLGDRCAFRVDRRGVPQLECGRYDASLYADCFAVIGLAAYGAAARRIDRVEAAWALLRSAVRRREAGDYALEPYPEPEGLHAHGLPMILTDTARAVADALEALGDDRAAEASALAYRCACETVDRFIDGDGVLREFVSDAGIAGDTLLERYINPGHTLEDGGFLLREFARAGDDARLRKALGAMRHALERGWDREQGGLQLFADREGGAPRGDAGAYGDAAMARKVQADWACKLWWPHIEGLYAALAARRYDPAFDAWCERLFDYTFDVFPAAPGEEWIQIRDRQGRPERRQVALPVKDPFHIARGLVRIIEGFEAGTLAPIE